MVLGGLWLLASLLAMVDGEIGPEYFSLDLAGFLALLVTMRHRRVGTACMFLALVVGTMLPPGQHGFIGVISFVAVISLLRHGDFGLAAVHSGLTFLAGAYLTFRANDVLPLPRAATGWLGAAAVTWVLGLGFRAQAKLAVVQERERHQRERMAFAWDLHDFVARDLTIISMRADHAIARGGAGVGELESIAQHSRAANRFLRETAKQFGDPEGKRDHRAVTIREAFETAERELADEGRVLVRRGELPPQSRLMNAVCGRILLEALHNATKHGTGPVEVDEQVDGDELSITVRNTPRHGGRSSRPTGIGLAAMQQRAQLFGGSMDCGPDGSRWTCALRLPTDAPVEAVGSEE